MTSRNFRTDEYREKHRLQMQRLGQTEGTYRYKEYHRQGLPGLTRSISNRRLELNATLGVVQVKLRKAEALVEQLIGDINGNR